MILRVDVGAVAAMVEIESHEPWTPEVLETLMRICAGEAMRTAITLGNLQDVTDEGDPDATAE